MPEITDLHSWQVTPKEAVAIQRELAKKVLICPLLKDIRYIAGLDAAFSTDRKYIHAAAVLWDLHNQCIVEKKWVKELVYFPYIPGLLSFREAPALLSVLKKLMIMPDLIMCDGQGIAHPRRLGIAAHIGVITGIPTLGCAKTRLIGKFELPENDKGAHTELQHKNEIIGMVLRTKKGIKPIFLSVGNKIDLNTAKEMIMACLGRYRLPEPIRLADQLSKKYKT